MLLFLFLDVYLLKDVVNLVLKIREEIGGFESGLKPANCKNEGWCGGRGREGGGEP